MNIFSEIIIDFLNKECNVCLREQKAILVTYIKDIDLHACIIILDIIQQILPLINDIIII